MKSFPLFALAAVLLILPFSSSESLACPPQGCQQFRQQVQFQSQAVIAAPVFSQAFVAPQFIVSQPQYVPQVQQIVVPQAVVVQQPIIKQQIIQRQRVQLLRQPTFRQRTVIR